MGFVSVQVPCIFVISVKRELEEEEGEGGKKQSKYMFIYTVPEVRHEFEQQRIYTVHDMLWTLVKVRENTHKKDN